MQPNSLQSRNVEIIIDEGAEATLAQRKGDKASYRSLALQIIAGSVVFISLVAMFLVLLSIQRNVRMLRETGGGGGA